MSILVRTIYGLFTFYRKKIAFLCLICVCGRNVMALMWVSVLLFYHMVLSSYVNLDAKSVPAETFFLYLSVAWAVCGEITAVAAWLETDQFRPCLLPDRNSQIPGIRNRYGEALALGRAHLTRGGGNEFSTGCYS